MNLKNYFDFQISYLNDKTVRYPGFKEIMLLDVEISRDLFGMRCSDYGEDAVSPRRREQCIVPKGQKFDQVSLYTRDSEKFLSMGMVFEDTGLIEVRVLL